MKTAAQIQKDVYEELKFDPRIHEGDVGVSVHNDVVTLDGYAYNFAEKWASEEAALRVKGVSTVVNDLQVRGGLSNKHKDQELAEAVQRCLAWNVWIPAQLVKAVVEDGNVTLTGTLDYHYQKETAADIVRNLSGVRSVINNINVRPHATVKDIKAHIKKALHRYVESDAENIDITVINGEVSLSGQVSSRMEKSQAESAAWQTPGVSAVKNALRIA